MCPVCKEVFRTRSDFTEHKAKTGHQGGAVIYTEPEKKIIKKPKSSINTSTTKKSNVCPVCPKRFKSKKALESHQKDKKHFDVKAVVDKKIETNIQDKLKLIYPNDKQKDLPEKKSGNGYVVIRDSDYQKIMDSVETIKGIINFETISFELLPLTNSWLVSYELSNETDWDYILFYCDFVEIEHTLESFMVLETKLTLDNKPIVFDMASLQSRAGLDSDIYQEYDCFFITQDEDKTVSYGDLFINLQQILLSKENNLSGDDLLLVAGNWKKPVKEVIKRPPPTYSKGRQMYNQPLKPKYMQNRVIQNDWTRKGDSHYQFQAEREVNIQHSADSKDSDKELSWNANPVYLITNERLCIDKLVNVKLVVIPKETPSEDDVKKKVNIEDDVQEEVNIEDDSQEEKSP